MAARATPAPRIGISSCLLGERVRWDGGDQRNAFLADRLGVFVEWVRICPELELGLGVPREPIQLLRTAAGFDLVTVETHRNLTADMTAWSARRVEALEDLDGYVLKARSPSCGLGDVRVYETEEDWRAGGSYTRGGRGFFADALVRRFPHLPVVDEADLQDDGARDHFVERIFAGRRLRDVPDEASPRGRIEFAGRHALQLRARSAEAMRSVLAAVEDPSRFREEFLRAMARPVSREDAAEAIRSVLDRWEADGAAPEESAAADRLRKWRTDPAGAPPWSDAATIADPSLAGQTVLVPSEGEQRLRPGGDG